MNRNRLLSFFSARFTTMDLWFLSAALIISFVFAYRVYMAYTEDVSLSPQSEIMLQAGLKSSGFGLSGTGPWPPGYSVLLFVANTIQIPLPLVNLLLFYVTLVLLTVLTLRCLPGLHPVWPLLLYVAGAFNYYNLTQFTSEALVVPLSMLVFLGLPAYRKKPTLFTLLWPALCCALLFLSRYHAIFWLFPIIVLHIAFGNRSWLIRLRHLIGFGVIATGPAAFFMLTKFLRTGYLTGVPRFSYESRQLSGESAFFPEQTTFVKNVLLTMKTYVIDFLSPTQYATHRANRLYELSPLELLLVLLVLLVGSIFLLTIIQQYRQRTADGVFTQFRHSYRENLPVMLLLEFFLAYIGITIIIWTLGNNDPIYSRFLFPSYPYFILLCFAGYTFVKRQPPLPAAKWLFVLLYCVVLTTNLYKISTELFNK